MAGRWWEGAALRVLLSSAGCRTCLPRLCPSSPPRNPNSLSSPARFVLLEHVYLSSLQTQYSNTILIQVRGSTRGDPGLHMQYMYGKRVAILM